jgi:hypothetical protein
MGISISHNTVAHADAPHGGGIAIARTSYPGPPPGDWPFIENLLIFHNQLSNLSGTPPTPKCASPQRSRIGIQLEGTRNVRETVLYGNRCERVDTPLSDGGQGTIRLCLAPVILNGTSCECP